MATAAQKPSLLTNMVPLYPPQSSQPQQFDSNGSQAQFYPSQSYDHQRSTSVSSTSSHHSNYENSSSQSFPMPSYSTASDISSAAAFGGVPVSADVFHPPPPQHFHHHQHARHGSGASSPYTEPTSLSDNGSPGDESNPGGRKGASQGMRRARSAASAGPYAMRSQSVSNSSEWDAHSGRSGSTVSDQSAEEEFAEMLRSASREGSVQSDWSGHHPHHSQDANGGVPNGLGNFGGLMDPYAAVASVHGHGQGGSQAGMMMPHQGGGGGMVVNPMGMGMSNMGMGMGLPPQAMMGVSGAGMMGMNGMVPMGNVGVAAQQMGRMSLDTSETFEALAHHIRTSVTTSASDRARQAFVQAWLNSAYIAYTDGNVSRQGLYGSYLRICQQYDIKPINSASFGKAVRQCFPNIKTRRLGVRGNSKYHYCGIRPATAKEAEILMNLSRTEQPETAEANGRTSSAEADDISGGDSSDSSSQLPLHHVNQKAGVLSIQQQGHSTSLSGGSAGAIGIGSAMELDGSSQPQTPRTARPNMSQQSSHQPMPSLGGKGLKGDTGRPVTFPELEEALNMPGGAELDQATAKPFWDSYQEHCKNLLEAVKSYRFDQFELTLRAFWSGLDEPSRELAQKQVVMSLIYRADAIIYDEILDYLHSQTLNQMPPQAFSSLRQLAQNMEQVIIVSLEAFSNSFVGPKVELAARFGHLIVRHLGICQLAQALAGVFANPTALKEMLDAWDGIDFEAVRNQAALVTNCQHEVLGHCFEDFRGLLADPNTNIEAFIGFVESTYERCLQPAQEGDRPLSPRSLLVRWCFVSSQLIRDLTLRSATSFGSFQIVNLFFDEWLGFKVLRRVALHVAAVAPPAESVDAQGTGFLGVPGGLQALEAFPLENGAGDAATMNFIFSPNTNQAFEAAQAQAQAQFTNLSAVGPEGEASNTTTVSPTPAAQSTTAPAKGAAASGTGDDASTTGAADGTADAGKTGGFGLSPEGDFSDLMDVAAFQMAMGKQANLDR